jgi:membrane protease YdiL (CAAX protease family)
MRQSGSFPGRPFPPLLALALAALGVLAMTSSVHLARPLGLGLRGQVALGTLALAAPAALALAFVHPAARAAFGTAPLPSFTLALSMLLGAALWVGSLGLMETQSLVLPPPPDYLELFRTLHAALAPKSPLDGLVSLVVIAVLPALCEELVMRGVLLPSLVVPTGPAVAVGLTAAAFALIHLDPIRLLFTFVLGLILGLVRLRTGSLGPPVMAHLTLNALTFALAPLVDDPSQPYTPQPALGLACLAAGTAVAWPLVRALGGKGRRPA